MSLTRVAGIIAVCFGVLFLLYLFAWCTLMPPGITGVRWWSTALGNMVSRGAVLGTVFGSVCVVGGAFLLFQRPRQRPSVISVIAMAVLAAIIILALALS